MPLARGISNQVQMLRQSQAIEAHKGERLGVELIGVTDSGVGSDVNLEFRATRQTPFVAIQIQNESNGGETYDAVNFVSRTRLKTIATKQHKVVITRSDTEQYWAFLVPEVQMPPACGVFTSYDGVDGDDRMVKVDLGKRTVGAAEIEDGSVLAQKLTESSRNLVTDVSFTATDHETVTWGPGDVVLADGTTYSITSGTTGAMVGGTYIYLDPDTSTTELQVSATLGDAVGEKKHLIAFAQPSADTSQRAFFATATDVALNEEHIGVNSISTNLLQAQAVTAAKISVAQLSAISADIGTVTAGLARDPNSRFVIDFGGVLQTITDDQTTPVERVKVGKLGLGDADYGIEVYDAAGALVLGATGLGLNVVGTGQVVAGAITAPKINVAQLSAISADVGTLTAGLIENAAGSRYIDLDATGSQPFINHDNFEIRADGTAIFAGNLVAASGTFAGTVSGDTFTANLALFDDALSTGNTGNQQISLRPRSGGSDMFVEWFQGVSGPNTMNVGWDGTDGPVIDADVGGLDLLLKVASNVKIDDGSANRGNVACVVVSASAPSGDYPEGTIWLET